VLNKQVRFFAALLNLRPILHWRASGRYSKNSLRFQSKLRPGEQEQTSGDAITSGIRDAGLSRLESMLSGVPLGNSPLFRTAFANSPIDERSEAVFNPFSNE
jgi:hypothetical protein